MFSVEAMKAVDGALGLSVTSVNVATVVAPSFKVSVVPLNVALLNAMLLSATLSLPLKLSSCVALDVVMFVMSTLLMPVP